MKFMRNQKALCVNSALVIADVHLGISHEFRYHGFEIPSQKERFLKEIKGLIKITGAQKLVLLGDVKHPLPGTPWKEKKEIRSFLEEINKYASIIIVKGNHDSLIEDMAPEDVGVVNKYNVGKFTLTHGHRRAKGERFIIGHNHPVIKFKDPVVYMEPAWIQDKNVIIVPAFNPLVGGCCVNDEKELLGPIAKNMNKGESNAFLLDGTYLGKIKDIMV